MRLGIRAKLLAVHALLVVIPVAGVGFARQFERELLRSEEEGMAAIAQTLAASGAQALARGAPLASADLGAGTRAAADVLGAQIRVVDPAGIAVSDTGPERVALRTRGRELLEEVQSSSRQSARAPSLRAVADAPAPGATLRARPEIATAFAGGHGRATRRAEGLRGVRLFVAEPVRASDGRVAGVVYVARTSYPVLVALYRVRNGLLRVAALSLAVALATAFFLALTLSRPLRALTEAARRIAAGERRAPVPAAGHDEIGDLARAFDAMARELDARLAYVSELAANVSHEFKTPIASIRGAAELLQDGAADEPAARARFLGNIVGDAERLARLTTRLLELSRIEAQGEAFTVLDYRALVTSTVARYQARDCALVLDYTAGPTQLRARAEALSAALANLIDNALAVAPAGTPVAICVSEGERHTLVTTVSDRGPGISPANLPRVWDRFFTTDRSAGGTGLGLAIVRAAIEAHGGSVGVHSEPGGGSSFWYALPRRA